jgi:hypothetical protein
MGEGLGMLNQIKNINLSGNKINQEEDENKIDPKLQ